MRRFEDGEVDDGEIVRIKDPNGVRLFTRFCGEYVRAHFPFEKEYMWSSYHKLKMLRYARWEMWRQMIQLDPDYKGKRPSI